MKQLVCGIALAAVTGMACGATDARAAGCAKPRSAFDQVYCSGNMFSQTNHDLNAAYADLRKHMKPSQQEMLRKGQKAWIRKREEQCSIEKPDGYYVNLDCAVTLTQDRLSFIKERERECKRGGCEDGQLGG